MLSINGKKFMNLPEAVQWLLNNNALPFQCKANYVADTVIAKSDIVNPSPAEIKVGSLVLFADSKVGTVSGVTDFGFMVGQDYTDIGSQLNQIVGIDLDASQHLIFTMANGDTIDAGLVKGVSSLTIDASQHLIVNYNDGSTQDLGAIFQGNVNIAGTLTADTIIENMSGYSFTKESNTSNVTYEYIYVGIVKTGYKLTLVISLNLTRTDTLNSAIELGSFYIPAGVGSLLYPTTIGVYNLLKAGSVEITSDAINNSFVNYQISKNSGTQISMRLTNSADLNSKMTQNTKYNVRLEATFLLSSNLAA